MRYEVARYWRLRDHLLRPIININIVTNERYFYPTALRERKGTVNLKTMIKLKESKELVNEENCVEVNQKK